MLTPLSHFCHRLALRDAYRRQGADEDGDGDGEDEDDDMCEAVRTSSSEQSGERESKAPLKLFVSIGTSPLTRDSPLTRPGTASMANLLPAHTPKNSDKLVWTRGTLLGKGAFGKVRVCEERSDELRK